MKTKKNELDVDFIGGQGSLTLEEEMALSDFFKQRKSISEAPARTKKTGMQTSLKQRLDRR